MRKLAIPTVFLVLVSLALSAFAPAAPALTSEDPAIPVSPELTCGGTLTSYGSYDEPIWRTHRVVSYVDGAGVLHLDPDEGYVYPHPIPTIYELGPGAHDVVLSWHWGTAGDDQFISLVPNPDCGGGGEDHGGVYWDGMVGFVNPGFPGYVCFILYDASQGYLPSTNNERVIANCDNRWPDGAHPGWTAGSHILAEAIGPLYNDGYWAGDPAVAAYTRYHGVPRLPLFADGDNDLDYVLCRNFSFCVR